MKNKKYCFLFSVLIYPLLCFLIMFGLTFYFSNSVKHENKFATYLFYFCMFVAPFFMLVCYEIFIKVYKWSWEIKSIFINLSLYFTYAVVVFISCYFYAIGANIIFIYLASLPIFFIMFWLKFYVLINIDKEKSIENNLLYLCVKHIFIITIININFYLIYSFFIGNIPYDVKSFEVIQIKYKNYCLNNFYILRDQSCLNTNNKTIKIYRYNDVGYNDDDSDYKTIDEYSIIEVIEK